jgi:hypothetical protein
VVLCDGVRVALTSGTTIRFAHDLASPLSQILQIGTITYRYGMERLAVQSDSTWTYDAAGALTNDGVTTYTYDALHRPDGRSVRGVCGATVQSAPVSIRV